MYVPQTQISPWILAFLVCLLLSFVGRIRDVSRQRLPGPTRLPFFGNALQLPRKRVWMKLSELAKTYGAWPPPSCSLVRVLTIGPSGPIYSLQIFQTPVIVINSVEVARELMEARSANYFTRPLNKMAEL